MIGVERGVLKKRVIDAPEILQVIEERAGVRGFLFSFYEGDYSKWTREFLGIIDLLREDRYS